MSYGFKDVSEVFNRDSVYPMYSLGELHSAIEDISLTEKVPSDISEVFDIAKNLCLYSFFAYRFHQASELIGSVALEYAYKRVARKRAPELFENEDGSERNPSMSKIIKRAIKEGWIHEKNFSNAHAIAESRVQSRITIETIQELPDDDPVGTETAIRRPTRQEVEEEFESMSFVEDMLRAGLALRNTLAHEKFFMDGAGSISFLATTSEIINQLFEYTAYQGFD